MARELLELGAMELLELGGFNRAVLSGMEDFNTSSPVLNIFRMVEFMEDPYAGILEPGDQITSRQAAIGQRLKTLSVMQRRGLTREVGLSGIENKELFKRSMSLCETLNGLALVSTEWEIDELGKKRKIFKKIQKVAKSVGKKVVKVVKSPAFLTVAGIAAGFIPGVGAVAGPALLAAASARAAYVKKAKAAKGQSMSWDETLGGQLAPIAATVQAAGMFGLMPDKEGTQQLMDSMPAGVQQQASGLVPGIANQIQTVGPDNFMSTVLKALGQGNAMNTVSGGGFDISGILDAIKGKIGGAEEAGKQDVLNSGAAAGQLEAVKKGLEEPFPTWGYVAIGGGVLIASTTIIAVAISK